MFRNSIKLTTIALVSIYLTTGCSSHSSNNSNSNENQIPPSPKSYKQKALIMGVENYAGENNANDLIGILEDTRKMNKLFNSWGFQTTLLANSLNFEQTMIDYADTLTKDDVFILYYSGHGSSRSDTNHDESDGKDELIVLSDSTTNLFYIDDKIDKLLSKIEAKKLLIFDSCNSGTVHKMGTMNKNISTKIKYMAVPDDYVLDTTIKKKFLRKNTQKGPLLFFAACQDYEQSIASSVGSLFTNSFIKKVSLDKSASQILTQTTEDLNKSNVSFHPNLTSSDDELKHSTLRKYLKIE